MITEDRLIEICTPDFPDITIAEIEQILSNQEKAKKYDDLMNANHEQVKENISLTETYQENKQLKEKMQRLF